MRIESCSYKIIVDTREQKINHILNKFEEGFELLPSHHNLYRGHKPKYTNQVEYEIRENGLKTGDYTIEITTKEGQIINFADKAVVERKMGLNELCNNLYDSKSKDEEGLNRFERELKRSQEAGIKMYLLVEQDSLYSKIYSSKHFRYDKASRVVPHSFVAQLESLLNRYNVHLVECDKKDSARVIQQKLFYFAKEYLKNMD
ncbi:MAG: ERCC4 domain-containing protein [Paraclostridium sp.]